MQGVKILKNLQIFLENVVISRILQRQLVTATISKNICTSSVLKCIFHCIEILYEQYFYFQWVKTILKQIVLRRQLISVNGF